MQKIVNAGEKFFIFLKRGIPLSKGFMGRIWDDFLYLSSGETARDFLLETYRKNGISEEEKWSFENNAAFRFHLEQGIHFFHQASDSPLPIQPILFFYGLVFLFKAAVLTRDPHYPASSQVLAHGVSTRKRKKQNYRYFEDEVKIQKNGLFPHLIEEMFKMPPQEGKKYRIIDLLCQIPELHRFLERMRVNRQFICFAEEKGRIRVPEEALDAFHLTETRLYDLFRQRSNAPEYFRLEGKEIFIRKKGVHPFPEPLPFRFDWADSVYRFCDSGELNYYRELLIHYLLLYHLSMLARYEVEWWAELVAEKPSADFPITVRYLQIAGEKIPFYIHELLFGS